MVASGRWKSSTVAAWPRAQARGQPARRTPSSRSRTRDVYTRRNEGVSIWVVKSTDITASSPGDREAVRACERQGVPASDVLSDA
jgi:hypothetical protein